MTEKRKSSKDVTLQLVIDFNKAAIRHSNAGNIEKLHEYIRKLYMMPMKVSFLRDSDIGKTMKEVIRRHPDLEEPGKALLYKWKNLIAKDVIDKDPSNSNSPVLDTPKVSDIKKIEFVPIIPDNLMSEEIANSIKNDLRAHFNIANEFSSSSSTESKSSSGFKSGDSYRESGKSSSDESEKSSRPISKRKRDHESVKSSSKRSKRCSVVEIDHQSGTSFADALSMMESIPNKPKKFKKASPKLDETVRKHKTTVFSSKKMASTSSTSTSLASNIRSTIYGGSILPARTQKQSDSDSSPEYTAQQKNHFLENVTTSKSNRTKVYSGLRNVISKIPSLTVLCTQVLRENINNIEYTGGVPYLIMKPIVEQADPEQLKNIEYHNPYLVEDTDELWERFCMAEFRDKSRQYVNKMLKWRDIYFQCHQDREDKLKSVAANIKKSIDNAAPTKQAKLALIDPVMPRFKRGKELIVKPITTASQKLVTKKNAENVSAIVPVPYTSQTRPNSCNNNILKPKTAPLMKKAIQILKTQIR